ncbi:ubiquitin-like protein [Heliocybe sulcata]|uniref:Ubiquitin-like protein n=1 Tax=Heliocybe sulcata TaxID=5364 RepID=A0A5C3N1M3_9AGAM|nr:ubiquitin-like protein [Heliocybe sulcata]
MTDTPSSSADRAHHRKPSLNIQLVFQDKVIPMRLRPYTSAQKIMDTALQMWHLEPGLVRFVYGGQRIREYDTPEKLNMEDGDQVDVMVEQYGGSSP